MPRKLLVAAVFLTPLFVSAQSDSAFSHANGNASFQPGNSVHAPEIDGGNAILGLALLGGIVSLMVRKNKKHKKED